MSWKEKGWLKKHATEVVVATIITGMLGLVGAWLLDFAKWVPIALSWLAEPVSTSRWFYWLTTGVTGTAAIAATVVAVLRRFPIDAPYHQYKEDNFFNGKWTWDWQGNTCTEPIPYCLGCNRLLIRREVPSGFGAIENTLGCDYCRTRLNITGSEGQIKTAVLREIDVIVRNGRWAERLPKDGSKHSEE